MTGTIPKVGHLDQTNGVKPRALHTQRPGTHKPGQSLGPSHPVTWDSQTGSDPGPLILKISSATVYIRKSEAGHNCTAQSQGVEQVSSDRVHSMGQMEKTEPITVRQ